MTWILTNSGKRVDILDPKPEQIDVADIAHGLAYSTRFNGQIDLPLSIAEHSIKVADSVEVEVPGNTYAELWALMHDAHEAYLGDMATPVIEAVHKLSIRQVIDELKFKMDRAIREALGLEECHRNLSPEVLATIKAHDKWAGVVERSFLLPDHPDWPSHPQIKGGYKNDKLRVLAPASAKSEFLTRYARVRSRLLREQTGGGRPKLKAVETELQ